MNLSKESLEAKIVLPNSKNQQLKVFNVRFESKFLTQTRQDGQLDYTVVGSSVRQQSKVCYTSRFFGFFSASIVLNTSITNILVNFVPDYVSYTL